MGQNMNTYDSEVGNYLKNIGGNGIPEIDLGMGKTSGSNGVFGGGTSLGMNTETLGMGLGLLGDLGNIWQARESNKLKRDTLNFNKDMMTKNYNLAKDAYDRRVRRSGNLQANYDAANAKGLDSAPKSYQTDNKIAKL